MSRFESLVSQEEFTEVVESNFFIASLETRNRDSLDFINTSVWAIDNALYEAYMLGVKHTINQESTQGVG